MIKHVHDTKAYIYSDKVLSDEILACKFIKKAAERFQKDLKRKDVFFDLKEVSKRTEFFEKWLHVPELRKPVPLPLPHAFWLQQLFGFKYRATGLRRFTSMYNQVARKNFKTFMAAGVSLCEGLIGTDKDAEIMQGANSRDQALICTDMIGKIIKKSPDLNSLVGDEIIQLFTYKQKVIEIVYNDGDRFCRMQAMPKDPGDGGNPSIGVVDEVHEAKDLSLLETIESGQGQRREPFTMVITSPGHNKQAPCYANLRKKSVDLLNGVIEDDGHLAIIFELDHENEWDKIEMLEKSNPMIPYSPTLRPYLERRILKAKNEGGQVAANIKIKNSGIWIDAAYIWIPSETVKANNHGITEKELEGRDNYCGLDLSAGMDLNAFVQFIPNVRQETRIVSTEDESGKLVETEKTLPIHAVKSMFWIPEQKITDQKNDAVDYGKWVDQGYMKKFLGNTVEYEFIANDMMDEMNKRNTIVLGADPKYLTTGPVGWLRNGGYLEPSGDFKGLFPVGQGFNLTAAVSEIEMWINNKQLDFLDNPVMEMCFANTTLHTKDMVADEGGLSGHRYPSKGRSNGRIDGVTGLCISVHEFLRLGAEPPKSEPGILGLEW